jgi:hypothetical protein
LHDVDDAAFGVPGLATPNAPAQPLAVGPQTAKRGQRVGKTGATEERLDRSPEVCDTVQANNAWPVTQPRLRGRPQRVRETESDIVEWWVPGGSSLGGPIY